MRQPDRATQNIQENLRKAKAAIQSGEFDFARQYAQQALKTDPENTEAKTFLERIPIERARRWNFLSRSTQSMNAYMKILLKKYDAAVGVAEALAKTRPNKPFWSGMLGLCCSKLGRWNEAITAFENVLRLKPNDIKSLSQLGELYVMVERHNDAVNIYHKLVSLRPKDQKAQRAYKHATARAYSEVGIPERIADRRASEEKVKIDDEREKEEKRQESVEKLKASCQQNPGDFRGRARLARLLEEDSRFEEALTFLEEAARLAPNEPKILRQLAETQQRLSHTEDALKSWTLLMEKSPDDPEAKRRVLGLKAETLAKKLQDNPDDETLRSEHEAVQSDYLDMQISSLELELQTNPQDMDLSIALGKAYRQRGKVDEAIYVYQTMAKTPTKAFVAFRLLGESFSEKNMNALAVEQYEKALERIPPHIGAGMRSDVKEIYYALGRLHELDGNLEKAKEAYKPVYEEDMHFKDVREKFENLYKK